MILRKFHPTQSIRKTILLVSLLSMLVAGYPVVHAALAKRSGTHQSPIAVALTRRQLAQPNAPPALLLLNADKLITTINGGVTTLTVRVRDAQSRALPGVTVQLHSTLGSVAPTNVTTDGAGAASVTFTAGALPGQAQVTAETAGLTRSAAIQVVKPHDNAANTLTLALNVRQLALGQSLPVAATLRDEGGAPLAGELVSFFGALGEVSPASALTDDNGQVRFTYHAGNAAGQAMLTVLAGYATQSATIQVGDPAAPGQPNQGNRLFLPLVNR